MRHDGEARNGRRQLDERLGRGRLDPGPESQREEVEAGESVEPELEARNQAQAVMRLLLAFPQIALEGLRSEVLGMIGQTYEPEPALAGEPREPGERVTSVVRIVAVHVHDADRSAGGHRPLSQSRLSRTNGLGSSKRRTAQRAPGFTATKFHSARHRPGLPGGRAR